MERKKLIIVTDGDMVAKHAVEAACTNLDLRCISLSAGNPTPLTGTQSLNLVLAAKDEPVVLMVDDRGKAGKGKGEQILEYLARNEQVELLGVLAVASNSPQTEGVEVTWSIDLDGRLVNGPVDKKGHLEPESHKYLEGDTVEVLKELDVPVVIGIGDIGKMEGKDDYHKGAPNTTAALKEILERSGYSRANS